MAKRIELPKEKLIQMYIVEQKSTHVIGKLFGVSSGCIVGLMKKYNIKRRSKSQARKLVKGENNPNYKEGKYIDINCEICSKVIKNNNKYKLCMDCYKQFIIGKKNYCIDCGIKISFYAIRCKLCNYKWMKKDNSFMYGKKGKEHPTYKHGHRSDNKKKCIDCGCEISFQSVRCLSCNAKYLYLINPNKNKGKNNPTFHSEEVKCSYCDKNLVRKISEIKKYKKLFCDNKCKYLYLTGEKNPSYIDGRSFEPYPIEFNDRLKLEIRKRDNYTCQNCGMTEEEHLSVIGTVLHVHHIDYNKNNCDNKNLITLCLWCNLRANKNRKYWKQFFIKVLCKL